MAMTKKDLIGLADAIREHNTCEKDQPFTSSQLDTLARFCKQSNSAFMRERWLGYISGENGKNGGRVK